MLHQLQQVIKHLDQASKLTKKQPKQKQSFIKSLLADDVEIIKRLYSTLGYNFAKVDAKTRKIDDTSLDLLISISRGEKTKISSINFLGNKKIGTKRLLFYMNFFCLR